jgi:hypothetical protein
VDRPPLHKHQAIIQHTPEQFEAAFDYAVSDDHYSPLVIDLKGSDNTNRLRKGFSEGIHGHRFA